jgi:hypothetical protein
VRVFSTACQSASTTSVVSKWLPFTFTFNWGNRKVGWMEDDSHVVFGQKFPGEKGSVRLCISMMQQSVVLSPEFWDRVFSHIFTHSHRKMSVVCRIDCLA